MTSISTVRCGLGLLAACLLLPAPGRAAESYDNCTGFIDSLPASINTQGVWCLRKNLSTAQASGEAIRIWANNVTIDCNGFKIGGLGAGPDTQADGIMTNAATNVTVRNCNIRGFQTGTLLYAKVDGYGGHVVEDNRFEANTSDGIQANGDGTVIRRNLVLSTGGSSGGGSPRGIVASGNVDIVDNIVSGVAAAEGVTAAPSGMTLSSNRSGTISGNRIRGLLPQGTYAYGIVLSGEGSPVLSGNHLVLHPAPGGSSYAIRCNSGSTAIAQDNVTVGWTYKVSACTDGGGNFPP